MADAPVHSDDTAPRRAEGDETVATTTRPPWEQPPAPPTDAEVEKAAAAENRMLDD